MGYDGTDWREVEHDFWDSEIARRGLTPVPVDHRMDSVRNVVEAACWWHLLRHEYRGADLTKITRAERRLDRLLKPLLKNSDPTVSFAHRIAGAVSALIPTHP
jgi:hypothetical protein